MNFIVENYTGHHNKIIKKYICPSHGGLNVSPALSWKDVEEAQSYAMVMEDPDAPNGPYIHWYIPFISPNINSIQSLHSLPQNIQNIQQNILLLNTKLHKKKKLFQGYNHTGGYGYYGPCCPSKKKSHHYIFTLFSLDKKLTLNKENLTISSTDDFVHRIENEGIHIIRRESISFIYKLNNYNNSEL